MLYLYGLTMNGGLKNMGCNAPGYVGSGCGIPLGGKYSSLGYTIKNPKKKNIRKLFFLY